MSNSAGARARVQGRDTGPESVLIIKPGSLGDVVHALPCAAAIRKAWPGTSLSWLIDDRWRELIEDNPAVTGAVIFPREKFRGPAGAIRALPWMCGLGKIQPSIALDLQGLLRSALMARFSRARLVCGLSDAREGARLLHDSVTPVSPREHAVNRYLHILDTLGLPRPEAPDFPLPEGIRPKDFTLEAPFILLHPFARGKGKSLSEKQAAAFCKECQPAKVVVAGRGVLNAPLSPNALNLLNRTTLREFLWLARAARFTVSVDSGPMHMAAALSPRLLAIHTWSDPRLVGPFDERAWIWQGGEIRNQNPAPDAAFLTPRRPKLSEMTSIAKWVTEHMY